MADKTGRAAVWTFVIYPESAPENWRSLLDDLHIPWVESPLHDKDTDPDGTPKKAHWHCLFDFGTTKKSYQQVFEYTRCVNSAPPEFVLCTRSMVRYFAHMDNPEKWQYPPQEIIGHGGFDVIKCIELLSARKNVILGEIMDWCDDNCVYEFADVVRYCRRTNNDDWFQIATQYCTLALNSFLKSARYQARSDC